MPQEINSTNLYPYRALVLVESTFANGMRSIGTGTLIGRNDVLTASHVIFSPELGGYATSIRVTPGADYNGLLQRIESAPFGTFQARVSKAWPEKAFIDADNDSMSFSELPWDMALLGLSTPIGLDVGWFGMDPDANTNQEAFELGYPDTGTGLMFGSSFANSSNGVSTFTYANQGSAMLGPGSSGGPLYLGGEVFPSIIGVKSSGNSVVNYWADIGFLYDEIRGAMRDNDVLVGGVSIVSGDAKPNALQASMVSEHMDGGAGIDLVSYGGKRAEYKISFTGNSEVIVVSQSNNRDADTLINIERLHFSDTKLAVDTAPTQSAGKAALLLGVVLPDRLALDASKQQLMGTVIDLFDQGYALQSLSGAILRLPIWDVLTNKVSPKVADIATYIVSNVYSGLADQGAINAAVAAMETENTASQGAYLASLVMSEASQSHIGLVGIQASGLAYG
jgi:V8-like Glu-specific endopeptidase